MLRCATENDERDPEQAMSLDCVTCEPIKPMDLIAQCIAALDERFKDVKPDQMLDRLFEDSKIDPKSEVNIHMEGSFKCVHKSDAEQIPETEANGIKRKLFKLYGVEGDDDIVRYKFGLKVVSQSFGADQSLVFVFNDLSIEVKLEREKVLHDYVKTMFGSITHELRTPLNAILSC